MTRDAVVVGGGIVGSSVAYHLAADGADVLLADRADEGRATDAGAGIVSPATSSRTASDTWFRLGVDAARYYPALVDRLAAEQDGPTGYAEPGLLAVAARDADRATLAEARRRIAVRQERVGYPPAGSVTDLAPGEATARVPPLATPAAAFHLDAAARVDGRTVTAALRRAGRAHGLAVRETDVERVRVGGGAVTGVVAGGERIDADAVVVAGGAWSAAFGDQLGVRLPVEPHRGQIAHLAVDGDPGAWPIVSAVGDHYLVPRPDGTVAAGATREPDAGFDPRVTAAGVREVLDEALTVAPGLGDAELRGVRVGLRPVSRDRLPVLGPVPGVAGAYVATGHGATGLQLGPYSGKLVADLVRGREPATDLADFRVDRF